MYEHQGSPGMGTAQIVYLLAAKLISSSEDRSLCVCPLAGGSVSPPGSRRLGLVLERTKSPGARLGFE